MYKKIIFIFMISISVILTGTSCGKSEKNTDSYKSSSEKTVSQNNPKKALEEIYKFVEIKGVEDGDKAFVTETLGIDESYFSKFYIKKTDAKYGVADVYIIEPTKGNTDKIVRALTSFRDRRALECKDYNIYNSYEIVQNAQIIARGEYIVMLMLEDTESAEEILKEYITG